MRASRTAIALFVVGALFAFVTLGAVGRGRASAGSLEATAPLGFDVQHSDLVPAQAQAFSDFTLYSAGDSFEQNALVGITRRLDPATPEDRSQVRANFVTFIYGRCETGGEDGCLPPLEIQIWPACDRNLASYRLTPAGDSLPHEDLTVRGVPAAFFSDDARLELYTGDVTVVIFGQDRDQLLRAADALRGVNNDASVAADLEPPVAGAREGDAKCSS
jgi:hypothetical protein